MPVDNRMYDLAGDQWWGDEQPLHFLRTAVVPVRLSYLQRVMSDSGMEAAGRTVVDVGCGGGLFAEELARLGMNVIGVDPAAASLETARQHASRSGLGIDYRGGAGEQLPVESASADLAVCVDVLEHVDDVGAVLHEVARVLRRGGLFFFDTINRTLASWLVGVKMSQDWRLTRWQPPRLHDWGQFVTPRELRMAASGAGLAVQDITGMAPTGSLGSRIRALRRLQKSEITYGEFGRRMRYGLSDDTRLSYLGHATKLAPFAAG